MTLNVADFCIIDDMVDVRLSGTPLFAHGAATRTSLVTVVAEEHPGRALSADTGTTARASPLLHEL